MTTETTTEATVHSYHEGQAVVEATLGDGSKGQVMANGATVELIDANGSAHTHRFLDVEMARAVFGGVGVKVAVSYSRTSAEADWSPPAPATAEEPAPAPEGAAAVEA